MHHQQNYIVDDTVKVTFVALDHEIAQFIKSGPNDSLRVATLDEIFTTESLVCADRSKTRDWFDLYVLMNRYGYTMRDFYRVFEVAERLPKFAIASSRLRASKPQAGDEGYEQLLEHAPSLGDMRAFFTQLLDQLEQQLAAEAFAEKSNPPPI